MSLLPSFSIFRHQGYRHFLIARVLIAGERQMAAVAIGWQIYDLARETRTVEQAAFMLGLVGLAQFIPVLLFSLIGGQAADRIDRKLILIASNTVRILVLCGLFAASFAPTAIAIPSIFVAAAAMGAVNAFTPAAAHSLYPTLVPRRELPQAIAWNSLGFQSAAVIGPAIGGFLYIGGPQTVYAAAAAISVVAVANFWIARTPKHAPEKTARSLKMIIGGLRFVRENKIVLGAISLDLVVGFFGGVTALLPVFARDVLHVGAEGLGLMRAAPAAGAIVVAFLLARRGLSQRVGVWMLGAVAVYGLAMLGFASSNLFWLSCAMLAVTGAADMISIYVRHSLIQLSTPDGMRGRVSSVSFIFVAASNELGEFQSGVAARFLGPAGAVILGGAVSIACAALWIFPFPKLAKADRFQSESLA